MEDLIEITIALAQANQQEAQQLAAQLLALDLRSFETDTNANFVSVIALLDNVSDQIVDLTTLVTDLQASVTALGSPQQAGAPVTLPTTPPAGYGVDNSLIAAAVWQYSTGTWEGYQMGTLLSFAGSFAYNVGLTWLVPILQNPIFGYIPGLEATNLPGEGTLPGLDPVSHIPGNSLVDDLNAQNPTWSFGWVAAANGYVQALTAPGGSTLVNTTITGWMYDAWINFLYTPSSGPPKRSTMGDQNQVLALIPLQY